jgi:hypothetical protein
MPQDKQTTAVSRMEQRICKFHPKTYLYITLGQSEYLRMLKLREVWLNRFKEKFSNYTDESTFTQQQ